MADTQALFLHSFAFALNHYLGLALVAGACWGYGRLLLFARHAPPGGDAWLAHAMAVTLGLGLAVAALQALAIAAAFTRANVLGLLVAGVLLAAWQAWRIHGARRTGGCTRPGGATPARLPAAPAERVALAILALTAAARLLTPLAPPIAFDETMYHLPYAREVAHSGALGIHDWLHFPWFPFNYDLLYAAALLLYDDVFAHLLHALAGWLAAAIVWRLGTRHADRVVGCLAAAIWLAIGDFRTALIDTGVALFVLAGFAALAWWWQSAPAAATRWLALAAFCLGIAAGAKYQALLFVPPALFVVLRRERRLRCLSIALAAFLLPCVYWYGRNAWLSGDPFNPMGSHVFGFSSWNEADWAVQMGDIRDRARWPSPLLWPVLLMPWHRLWRRSAPVRALGGWCAYALLAWALTSRYPRYLVPAAPLLALGAALGWQRAAAALQRTLRLAWPAVPRRLRAALAPLLGLGLVAASAQQLVQDARAIAPTPATRHAYLQRNLRGYAVMSWLRAQPPGRIYQVALSDAIYYGPGPVWGDVFGPWRYRDALGLPPQALARRLHERGFAVLAVDTRVAGPIDGQPDFARHFSLLWDEDGVKAFRILGPGAGEPPCPTPAAGDASARTTPVMGAS